MSERRKSKRIKALLNVFDQASDSLLGVVVNIHAEGMMIICDHELPIGKKYRVWVEIPGDTEEESNKVFLSVISRWCFAENKQEKKQKEKQEEKQEEKNPDLYSVGFSFNLPSQAIAEYTQILIYDLVA